MLFAQSIVDLLLKLVVGVDFASHVEFLQCPEYRRRRDSRSLRVRGILRSRLGEDVCSLFRGSRRTGRKTGFQPVSANMHAGLSNPGSKDRPGAYCFKGTSPKRITRPELLLLKPRFVATV